MVVIRLSLRARPKNRPYYQILVADQRFSSKKRYIERVGGFNPLSKGADALSLDLERIEYWIAQGAHPTPRLKQLIKRYRKQHQAA